MATTDKKTCSRCKGKGKVDSPVMYAGVPGTCFSCRGKGEVYKDKFYRAYGVGKTFYGITDVYAFPAENPNNGTYKSISTEKPDWCCPYTQYTVVEITEEQARKFFDRFGTKRVKVA